VWITAPGRSCVQVLAHAGGTGQVDHLAAGQLRHLDAALAGQLVVAPANQVERIAAQGTGIELQQVRTRRGQCDIGLALAQQVQAVV
jgi:hypothetical protein